MFAPRVRVTVYFPSALVNKVQYPLGCWILKIELGRVYLKGIRIVSKPEHGHTSPITWYRQVQRGCPARTSDLGYDRWTVLSDLVPYDNQQ